MHPTEQLKVPMGIQNRQTSPSTSIRSSWVVLAGQALVMVGDEVGKGVEGELEGEAEGFVVGMSVGLGVGDNVGGFVK